MSRRRHSRTWVERIPSSCGPTHAEPPQSGEFDKRISGPLPDRQAEARFIADLDPTIPYSLLGFGPNFYMPDLPCTSVRHAEEAEAAARAAGLTRVRVGNRRLLSRDY